MSYYIDLSGIRFKYISHYDNTLKYFGPSTIKEEDSVLLCDEVIEVNESFFESNYKAVENIETEDDKSYLEFWCMMPLTCQRLLYHNACIFHGVSFLWGGKAWIITASSGVGKTTQYKNWKRVFGNQAEIINGDKTILTFQDNGQIEVSSSPWKGKEGYWSRKTGNLAGIIYLEQGKTNTIRRMTSEEAVLPFYLQFLSYIETVEDAKKIEEIETRLISSVPVWKLVNTGDVKSTLLTAKTLYDYITDEDKDT